MFKTFISENRAVYEIL